MCPQSAQAESLGEDVANGRISRVMQTDDAKEAEIPVRGFLQTANSCISKWEACLPSPWEWRPMWTTKSMTAWRSRRGALACNAVAAAPWPAVAAMQCQTRLTSRASPGGGCPTWEGGGGVSRLVYFTLDRLLGLYLCLFIWAYELIFPPSNLPHFPHNLSLFSQP